jgi:hypothetical protein
MVRALSFASFPGAHRFGSIASIRAHCRRVRSRPMIRPIRCSSARLRCASDRDRGDTSRCHPSHTTGHTGHVPRRFDRVRLGQRHGARGDRASRSSGWAVLVEPPGVRTCARTPSETWPEDCPPAEFIPVRQPLGCQAAEASSFSAFWRAASKAPQPFIWGLSMSKAPLQASTLSSWARSGNPSRTRNRSSFQEPAKAGPLPVAHGRHR